MNEKLVIGLNKTAADFFPAKPRFLLIDDGPIADEFLKRYPRAKEFDYRKHSFNPLPMAPRDAREFAAIAFGDEGATTLTVRNGKRALRTMLREFPRLDKIRAGRGDAEQEALATVEDILESPVLQKIFCERVNFSFKCQMIVARIDRAEIGDDESKLLADVMISRFDGTVIIPDFGFYARPSYMKLIREKRLIAGLHTLSELDKKLRDRCLLMEKVARGCTYEDAETLAQYAKLRPDPTREHNPYNEFIDLAMA